MRARFSICFVFLLATPAVAEPIARERIKVFDGDTVRVDGVRIRLTGCDTPKTPKRDATPSESGGSVPLIA